MLRWRNRMMWSHARTPPLKGACCSITHSALEFRGSRAFTSMLGGAIDRSTTAATEFSAQFPTEVALCLLAPELVLVACCKKEGGWSLTPSV